MSSFAEANRFHRIMRSFANSRVGATLLAPVANGVDQLALRVSGGRRTVSGVLTGIAPVRLSTIGAESGRRRTVMVLGLPHPDGLAVIASNFGRVSHPAWYHNLRAHPEATVTSIGEERRVRARLASPAERDAIWATGLEVLPDWRKYKERADSREIQAFVLVPVGQSSGTADLGGQS